MQRGEFPYSQLGRRLGQIRRSLQETIHEVSGAVELESDILTGYEKGESRPSEDILMLLISHFDIKDDEADELWDLAGYANPSNLPDDVPMPSTLVVIPMDNRIVYTDSANVSVNNNGLVINFIQNGPAGQPVPVSRVGMSLNHAKNVYEILGKTIKQAEEAGKPKLLSSPSKNKSNKSK